MTNNKSNYELKLKELVDAAYNNEDRDKIQKLREEWMALPNPNPVENISDIILSLKEKFYHNHDISSVVSILEKLNSK